MMTAKSAPSSMAASKNISKRIQDLGDWRGETLAGVRRLIHDADPEIQEERKWEKASSPGTPVWSHDGGVCTGESFVEKVPKLRGYKFFAAENRLAIVDANARRCSW